MPPRMIVCDGANGRGSCCGQLASIDVSADVLDDDEQFVELRYVIDCPSCGRRTQTVKIARPLQDAGAEL